MRIATGLICAAIMLTAATAAQAGLISVEYTVDAGGKNGNPLNGLGAGATFETSGVNMTVLLFNTSAGVPVGFDAADSLLVSLGFNLPTGTTIVAGSSAVIGSGSIGLAKWSDRGPGASVAEEWAWTNQGGGDLLSSYTQIITTSQGNHGLKRFDGLKGTISGPFGGIAASPPLVNIPGSQRAVSNSILFSLTLSGALTDEQLAQAAGASIVEYGSDVRYLTVAPSVPEPASFVLAACGMAGLMRRRFRNRVKAW